MADIKNVEIRTQFRGHYTGKLLEIKIGLRTYSKAIVEILEIVEQPKQRAILFPGHSFKRTAYQIGQIVEFDLEEIMEGSY